MYLDDEEGVRSCRSSGVAESGVEVRIEEGRGKVAGSRQPEVRSYYRETAEDEDDDEDEED
jgi:hypothetical protein